MSRITASAINQEALTFTRLTWTVAPGTSNGRLHPVASWTLTKSTCQNFKPRVREATTNEPRSISMTPPARSKSSRIGMCTFSLPFLRVGKVFTSDPFGPTSCISTVNGGEPLENNRELARRTRQGARGETHPQIELQLDRASLAITGCHAIRATDKLCDRQRMYTLSRGRSAF